jgi:hypothetical protein
MSNKAYFYSVSGTVEGPHSPSEIVDLLIEGSLSHAAHLIKAGDPDWKTIADFPDVLGMFEQRKNPKEDMTGGPASTISSTAEERAEADDEKEELKTRRKSRHGMLRIIRASPRELEQIQPKNLHELRNWNSFSALKYESHSSHSINANYYRLLQMVRTLNTMKEMSSSSCSKRFSRGTRNLNI